VKKFHKIFFSNRASHPFSFKQNRFTLERKEEDSKKPIGAIKRNSLCDAYLEHPLRDKKPNITRKLYNKYQMLLLITNQAGKSSEQQNITLQIMHTRGL
jgi:hypothetical protein